MALTELYIILQLECSYKREIHQHWAFNDNYNTNTYLWRSTGSSNKEFGLSLIPNFVRMVAFSFSVRLDRITAS